MLNIKNLIQIYNRNRFCFQVAIVAQATLGGATTETTPIESESNGGDLKSILNSAATVQANAGNVRNSK